jgi:hypothetical protein
MEQPVDYEALIVEGQEKAWLEWCNTTMPGERHPNWVKIADRDPHAVTKAFVWAYRKGIADA